MPRILPRTFFGQLVFGTILVQTLFLVLFTWYIIVSQRRAADGRSRVRVAQQLERLSKACAKPLAKGDMEALHEVLELSRISPTIDVARLTDRKGATLDVTDNGRNQDLDPPEMQVLPTANHLQVFELKNGLLEAVAPVLRDGIPVALIWIEPNRSVTQSTSTLVIRICITYGGFALLANLLPVFLIVRRMTRPLKSLQEATHRLVQNPALTAGFPLPVTTTNEAGELTHSFNAMVRELEGQRSGLLETLELLDSTLGNAPIGFAFFDRELRYVRVNEFLAGTHGSPVNEHVGRGASDFYPDSLATEKEAAVAHVFETGEPIRDVHLSGEMSHAPGVQRSWVMHFYPVRTLQGVTKWVGIVVVEITERLQAEEALRKTEKLAAAGRLAASIAHEINNPLESVTNLLYLLDHHEPMDSTARDYVKTAQAELARVSEITQQTLRFYRQSTHPSETNVAEILNAILALYHPRLTSASVTVNTRVRGEATIFGFSGELRQLFANLIGNATDAMPHGGCLDVRVHTGSGRQNDGAWCEGVHITITDTGIGMSEATLRRIFEAFYTTKEATGTGLGLWVSEEIVRKHGGTIRVRSRQGASSGTTFMLFFPSRFSVIHAAFDQPEAEQTT